MEKGETAATSSAGSELFPAYPTHGAGGGQRDREARSPSKTTGTTPQRRRGVGYHGVVGGGGGGGAQARHHVYHEEVKSVMRAVIKSSSSSTVPSDVVRLL